MRWAHNLLVPRFTGDFRGRSVVVVRHGDKGTITAPQLNGMSYETVSYYVNYAMIKIVSGVVKSHREFRPLLFLTKMTVDVTNERGFSATKTNAV